MVAYVWLPVWNKEIIDGLEREKNLVILVSPYMSWVLTNDQLEESHKNDVTIYKILLIYHIKHLYIPCCNRSVQSGSYLATSCMLLF